MIRFLSTLILTILVIVSFGQVKVRGYYRKNGTYVQPHYRSNPDGNPYNNYSYPGNVNPYTGQVASGNPDTYLNNYYNRGSTNSSNAAAYNLAKTQTYKIKSWTYNYTSYSLYSANYSQMATSDTRYSYYKINDNFGNQVGYTTSKNFKKYIICDNFGNQIGTVKMTTRGYYTVDNKEGHKLYTNKPKGQFVKTTFTVIGVIGLLALLNQ